MEISVLIPSYRRSTKLIALLRSLHTQSIGHDRYEVIVGLDGTDPDFMIRCQRPPFEFGDKHFRIFEFPHRGAAAARNTLSPLAQGKIVLWLNDDVIAAHDLLEAHCKAHRDAESRNVRAMVLGSARWREVPDETVFDRLIKETSMVFFYNVMDAAADREARDWGFRHAWTLNLSLHRDDLEAVNGFRVFEGCYGMEDVDLGYRVSQLAGGRPLWYRPGAAVEHDHRLMLEEYLTREYRLGRTSWTFAHVSPEAARATLGRDVRGKEEIDYSQAYVKHERLGVGKTLAWFKEETSKPASMLDADIGGSLCNALYKAHLPLKRWCWRLGLLHAAKQIPEPSASLDELVHESHQL